MTNTAKFGDADKTSIIAVLDGQAMTIPVDPMNRHYRRIVDGIAADAELGVAPQAPITIEDYSLPAPSVEVIQAEADRRVSAGIITAGKPYKTDDSTTQKLRELVQGFRDGDVPIGGYTFSTAAGDAVTYETEAQADFIRRIANAYRAQVLAASHVLQTSDPIPADYTDDVHWPNYVDVI